MQNYVGFGAFIKRRRKELGLTQREACDYVGWSVSYLSELEQNLKQPPSPDNSGKGGEGLVKLAEILQIPYAQLSYLAGLSRRSVSLNLTGADYNARLLAVTLAERFVNGFSDNEVSRLLEILGVAFTPTTPTPVHEVTRHYNHSGLPKEVYTQQHDGPNNLQLWGAWLDCAPLCHMLAYGWDTEAQAVARAKIDWADLVLARPDIGALYPVIRGE